MLSRMIQTGIAVVALLIAPLAAQAADIPSKAPSYSAPSYFSWSGFYTGLNGGYGFGNSTITDATGISTGSFNMSGALAGVTLGYNYQTGVWVWGLEGDLDASWIKGSTTVNCGGTCETKNSWLGTARGRIGYAWDRWMPYITGGAAFGDVKMTPVGGASETDTRFGWTAGGGLEYAFQGAWSAKVEYLYVDLGKASCSVATCGVANDVTFKTSIVRGGINYHF